MIKYGFNSWIPESKARFLSSDHTVKSTVVSHVINHFQLSCPKEYKQDTYSDKISMNSCILLPEYCRNISLQGIFAGNLKKIDKQIENKKMDLFCYKYHPRSWRNCCYDKI